MSRNILLLVGVFFSLTAFGEERQTVPAQPKYQVSQAEAAATLSGLKEKIAHDSSLQRPSASAIAVFNGGTAQVEENIADRGRPCWADEDQFQEIQKQLINPWLKAWKNKDTKTFEALLSKENKVAKFPVGFVAAPEKLGEIDYYANWHSIKASPSVKDYLEQFKKIEDFEIVTFKYSARREYRDKNLAMVKADLHVQFDLRGITQKGERRNDRGPMNLTVAKNNGKWVIQEIQDWGLETVVSRAPSFEDTTKVSGLTAIPEYQRLEAIRRGGYAIALGDINGDGIQDMYVGAFGPGKLLKGEKGGTFVALADTGLEEDTHVKSAAFADFNNDGLEDLLLTRFVPTSGAKPTGYVGDILIYKNLGKGKFKKMDSLIADRTPSDYAMPASVGDFNGDGLLDFYVGFPGVRDFTVFGKIPEREGIRAQGVYMNLGNFKFSENNVEDYNQRKFDKVTDHQRIYPHSSVALDFDQDGDTDIVVIDDRGNISPAYQNNGQGRFIQAQQHIGVKLAGFGMGMAAADIDNNGILDLVFSNVNFTNKIRTDVSCQTNWNHDIFHNEKDHGLKFYYGMKKGEFADATMKNGLFYAGEGLAGLEFLDYNNDGFQDLYVANGLWTGTDKEQDLSPLFMKSWVVDNERALMEVREKSQSVIMNILSGFKGDIFTNKQGKARPHLAGFQRNRLFRNKGDGHFVEVGYVEGVDSLADGYVIAKADIDQDGDLDLILRNGDPGTKDVNFPAVQVYKNNSRGNSVRLKLVADTGTDAIGAAVTLSTGDTQQYQQLIANNGTAQSERIMHFGLGKYTQASKVVITWPSKKMTVLENVPAGTHVIQESGGLLSAR